MSGSRVRFYVKSVKTVTGSVEVDGQYLPMTGNIDVKGQQTHSSRYQELPRTSVIEPKHEYILPEDQETISETVKKIASKYGLEVDVIDVGRENILHRAIQQEREKIKAFPALLADSGERIEGDITEEQAESFLSRIADRAKK